METRVIVHLFRAFAETSVAATQRYRDFGQGEIVMTETSHIPYDAIWASLTSRFRLGEDSLHGPDHWRRVEQFGIRLATATEGADLDVVRLFAVFHDSRRQNEFTDPDHGPLAAQSVRKRQGDWFTLSEWQLETLCHACHDHADGHVSGDPTIGCCWDADRLDLPRVGIPPHRDLMSTELGKTLAAIQR